MLIRVVAIVLFTLLIAGAAGDLQLIGTWRADGFPDVQMIFRPDHTYTGRSGAHRSEGTWRVEGDRLTTIDQTGSSKEQVIDTVRFTIRADKLLFGLHETTKKSHARRIGNAEQWMTGLIYRRVR